MIEKIKNRFLKTQMLWEWSRILRDLNALDILVLEFEPSIKNDHWAIIVEPSKKSSADINFYQKMLNADLNNGFKNSQGNKAEYFKQIFSEFVFSGFCIPDHDVERVDSPVLRNHIFFYQLLLEKFQYQNLFSTLAIFKTERALEKGEQEHALPQIIWFYIFYYAQFLHQLKMEDEKSYKTYRYWFTDLLDIENFHSRLPSEQITILLLKRCEALVDNSDQQYQNQLIFSKGSDEVNAFFGNFETEIKTLFGKTNAELIPRKLIKAHSEMKRAFTAVFLNDYENLAFQDVLDNQSQLNLYDALSMRLQLKYGPKSLFNMSGVIKDKIFKWDERPAGTFKEDDPALPNFRRKKEKLYPEKTQFWFDVLPETRAEINAIIEERSVPDLRERSRILAEKRSLKHWINLINIIAAPILFWDKSNKEFTPKLNLFDDQFTSSLKILKKKKEGKKRQEKEVLERHLKAILAMDSMDDFNAYQKKHQPIFSFYKIHNRWIEELKRSTLRIKQREKYYETRMKEYGIWESDLNKKQKLVWLKELLSIEEEVKPYITFVKKAFQAALPIRRKVTFSDYRHSNDGSVFDADTLFDHEKWIRADVMKVMESKVEIGDAIQVNTFCMDYSGSMNHYRMRNLFKTLYLLVLGLEDRKSFDAFHFFSNQFFDVVDFSNEFTNRKVLFKIMQQITTTSLMGQMTYRGEGGTNMSLGIEKSHEKMKTFVEQFQKTNPNANVVSSIFTITDGEPSLGITVIDELNSFIQEKRNDGDVAIKGIFIRTPLDIASLELMEHIFGSEHFVETEDFEEGVNKFVKIMTETYKQQRKNFKWKQKKRKLGLTK